MRTWRDILVVATVAVGAWVALPAQPACGQPAMPAQDVPLAPAVAPPDRTAPTHTDLAAPRATSAPARATLAPARATTVPATSSAPVPAVRTAAGPASAPAGAESRPVGGLRRAADGGVESHPVGGGTYDGGAGWWRTLAALAVVVILIFVVKLALRRLHPAARMPAGPGAVEVLARTALPPRHQLHLVRLGKRLLLVATAGESMATLSEITQAEEVAAVLGELQAAGKGGSKTVREVAAKIRSQLSQPGGQP